MRKILNEELGRLTPQEAAQAPKLNVVVVLDNVRSAQNVGAFFRTADAFAIDQIVLCGITATPPSKEIHKSALGAEMTVKWAKYDDTKEAVETLKKDGFIIIAVEQVENSVMLNDAKINKKGKYALVFGNEVDGVAQDIVDMTDMTIEIPQSGTKHSLNVSVAAGITMWEFYKQLK